MVKIFSNFDTSLYKNILSAKQKEFGSIDVLGIRKWYIFFIFNILPLVLWVVLLLVGIRIFPLIIDTHTIFPEFVLLGLQIFFSVLFMLYFWPSITGLYIDYKMDFTIITPIELISYNQSNLFTRSSKTIKVNNIKTISLDKSGLVKSIFNYGTLIFLSEWDEEGKGELDIFYVSAPEKVKDEASRILSLKSQSS